MRKKLFLLVITCCLLLGNLSVFAKEKSFVETPQDKVDIVSSKNIDLDTKSTRH